VSVFGWSYPPGCSSVPGDAPEGPMDCPVCVDGVELAGDDCLQCGNVTCTVHGCVECQKLEAQRVYCQGMWCGDYLRAGVTPVVDYLRAGVTPVVDEQGRRFCSEQCRRSLDEVRYENGEEG
jgi:hypothetical protein